MLKLRQMFWPLTTNMLIFILLCSVSSEELPVSATLVQKYSEVFSIKGQPTLANEAHVVVAATDRLRMLLRLSHDMPLDLQVVRNLTQGELLKLLFYAAAGSYSTTSGAPCQILVDVETGALEYTNTESANEGVLIGLCVTLLCILTALVLQTAHAEVSRVA